MQGPTFFQLRQYKKITEQVTREVLTGNYCDLCGEKSFFENSWKKSHYEVNETEISVIVKQRDGNSFPEGGCGQEYRIDLCPDCFKGRLVPWLISEGANIRQEDWDW